MDELIIKWIGYIGVLAIGALINKLFNDKKLEKLQTDSNTKIEKMSMSVIDLDKNIIELVGKISNQTDDIKAHAEMLEELFTRLREVEGDNKVSTSKLTDLIEACRTCHKGQ